MNLRKLELKDAPFMLEWMHDSSVVGDLKTNFAAKTIEDCNEFIESAQNTSKNMHLAIVDDNDTYIGTVSLKHITGQSAEFAITIRKFAMGKGFSRYGMSEIIRIGIEELGLRSVYWCVAPENKRAVRFYDKNNYQRIKRTSSVWGVLQQGTNQPLYLVRSYKVISRGNYLLKLNTIRKFLLWNYI